MAFFCEKRKNCIFLIQFWDVILLAVRVSKSLHKSAAFLSLQWWRLCYYWVFKVRELVSASYIRIWTSFSNLEEQTIQDKKVGNGFFVHFLMIRGVVMQFLFCFVCLFYLVFCFFHKKKYSPVGLSSMQFFVVI